MAAVIVEYLQAACDSRVPASSIGAASALPKVLTRAFDSVETAIEAPMPERCNYAVFNNGLERYLFTPAMGWQKIPDCRMHKYHLNSSYDTFNCPI